MKPIRHTIALLFFLALAAGSYGQQLGELDRFNTESLSIENDIKLFPNPTIEYLMVRIDNSTLRDVKFVVHNIIGNVVEAKIEVIKPNEYKIIVKDLAPGYYLLSVSDVNVDLKKTYKFLKRQDF